MAHYSRFNIFGGPSAGKTNTQCLVYRSMSRREPKIEIVTECAKAPAYQKRPIQGFYRVEVFAQQMAAERVLLENGARILICDSPLLLQCMYSYRAQETIHHHLYGLAWEFEMLYPSYNIFLERDGIAYCPDTRYENEQQAKEVDGFLTSYLAGLAKPYHRVKTVDEATLLHHALAALRGDE